MSPSGAPDSPILAQFEANASWPGRPTKDDLARLPGGPSVILFVDQADRPVQLLAPQQTRRVATVRLQDPEDRAPGRADLAAVVRGARWRPTHSAFESRWWYYRAARDLYPGKYRKMVTFGPASYLCLDNSPPVGEIRVSDRIWSNEGTFAGPWPTQRAAREALEGLWDLFDLCRYPEQVRRLPDGRRCAYYDMGRCDAPCDGTAPPAAYAERVHAAWQFVQDGPADWLAAADERMRSAAARQEFEQATLIKSQIAFARRWQTEWADDLATDNEMNQLLLIPATRRKAWTPFLFLRGELLDGPLIPTRKLPTAAIEWAQTRLSATIAESSAIVRMEQSWLVAHFLRRRERADAIVINLRESPETHAAQPQSLSEQITTELERRHNKPPNDQDNVRQP